VDVRPAARERQADHPQHDLVAFAGDARFLAGEQLLDAVELRPDTRFGLEPLDQRYALLGHAAEPLVELANLVLELDDARTARLKIELGFTLALAKILDVGDEIPRDRLDTAIQIGGHVGRSRDL